MSKPGRGGSCLVASLFVFALACGTNEASARGFGGGHGGGGGGGGFRAGGAHFGGGSFRGMSGAGLRGGMGGLNRNFAVRSSSMGRSFTSFHSTRQIHTSRSLASQNFTRMGSSRALTRSGNLRLGSNSLANRSINRQFAGNNRNLVTGSVNGAGRTSLLRNPGLASFASRNGTAGMLRQASFNGALAGRNWKNWNGGNWNGNGGWWWLHNRPIFVIGWFGSGRSRTGVSLTIRSGPTRMMRSGRTPLMMSTYASSVPMRMRGEVTRTWFLPGATRAGPATTRQ